ncbi:MAG: ATP-binding cassette domain-containing protein, partial [Gammaproteobacteria bacterium]|nr:ATP-binding cassette domain-containing protein [Gammaproteobacteria bacterium]
MTEDTEQPTKKPDIPSLVLAKKSYYFRKKSRDAAYQELSSVIADKRAGDDFATMVAGDIPQDALLLKTCQLIGVVEKIDFVEGFKNASEFSTPLERILRASNVRSRKVTLDNVSWNNDHGPLLGFLKQDNTPVALIMEKQEYTIQNLSTGTRLPLNQASAETLDSVCYSFFSPLPTGKLNAWALLKFILDFTRKDLIFFLALGVLSALLSLVIPVTAGYVFNVIVPGGELSSLYEIGALLVCVVLVLGMVNFTKAIAVLKFEGKSSYKLQSAVWDRILCLKVPFFGKFDPGNLAERSLAVEKIRTILSANVMGAMVSAIFSLSYLGLMIYYDFKLALIALALGTVVATFTLTISKLAYKHVAGFMRQQAIISGFMMMMMGGMQKLRMTTASDKVFNIWADKFSQQKQHYANKQKLINIAAVFTFGFPVLASILIYLRIFDLMTLPGSGFRIGDFIAFNSAYLSFQGALISAFMVTVPLMSIKPAFELLKPVLEADAEEYSNKKDPGQLQGNIEISHLKFRYTDAPDLVLNDLSLTIDSGEFVALVGGSGSGKSTLFRILLGFEEYESGTVLFDTMDLKDLDIRTVRDQMGVVLQNGKIIQGTVLYNIVGSANFTEDDAWSAARMAGCDIDIRNMERQMQTVLPAGGGILSGGQKQRIVIARALIKKPKLLLFDEATSSLDNDTQQTVTDNVN